MTPALDPKQPTARDGKHRKFRLISGSLGTGWAEHNAKLGQTTKHDWIGWTAYPVLFPPLQRLKFLCRVGGLGAPYRMQGRETIPNLEEISEMNKLGAFDGVVYRLAGHFRRDAEQ